MDLKLKGRVALVTGGGSGIGAAIAHALVEEGAAVAICGRQVEPLEEVAASLRDARPFLTIQADTGSPEQVQRLVERVVEQFDALDILVNNAGSSLFASFEEIPDERWLSDLNVKLVGYARCLRETLPHLRRSAHGCVVNVGGNAGRHPLAYHLPGGAANAGLLHFTVAMAEYLGPEGVRVVGVAPGLVDTPRLRKQVEVQARLWGVPEEAARARMIEQIPLRTVSRPDDVANLVCFLVSDRARMITGTTITIDGGFTRGI
ncbi:MAG TPA: SDR family oxidoreductase [Actinomycetes bacterium]|nr:SDR family oxidoreductase [Actinomycetes bacterium]